ncbi:hypothetical protein [Methanobrevibacter millerae]|uniref:Uncharacterized protein n=1 Tax=Methanobrevibacter millerae TaxID=230361 RepID=A0A1G5VBJ8_9EURY|nr:hypothetical protein [Methanobrevibacter millerae]SDA43210.1 hypothetical protein SAMN02910315_00511 [Methanobrevibacter millerae]
MDYSDNLELEKRTIFDEFKLVGMKEGMEEGSLSVLNAFANDPEFPYDAEQLAERFGFTVDEILDWKAE